MSQRVADTTTFDAKAFVSRLTDRPGVYRMIGEGGQAIYVGKARNLRRRVGSYFLRSSRSIKTEAMVRQVHDIEVTVTHTEAEALILENNLIKTLKPRYNVLLRDDKSYPYIYLSSQQAFPRLAFYRGSREGPGRYFGPFPSAAAVRETLNYLQKVFPVRQCEDSFFRNRSRPCLQYQIKRCTAPCVGYVSEGDYARDVRHAVMFLEGKSHEVIDELVARMEAASAGLDFEEAARIRDRIAVLRRIQERQYVMGERGDLDIVVCAAQAGVVCVQVFYIRGGRSLGNKTFFPKAPSELSESKILSAFLPRYYLGKPIPREVIVEHAIPGARIIEEALSQESGYGVALRTNVRGERRRWLDMARENIRHALAVQVAGQASMERRFEALQDALDLPEMPGRIECFDISHTGGEATVASCVVFNREGPLKSDYRRFNIEGIGPGDDYAAMHQALTRRYTRVKRGEAPLPDLLLIDGGKGQLAQAHEVLNELQLEGVTIVGIAKGPHRRPGEETLFVEDGERPVILPYDSPALHLLQHARDEAHRFAITGHRQRRGKKRITSVLERVPGLGPKRRQKILKQFGGLQGVARAGVEDLASVPGVSKNLAKRVYAVFHNDRG